MSNCFCVADTDMPCSKCGEMIYTYQTYVWWDDASKDGLAGCLKCAGVTLPVYSDGTVSREWPEETA